MVLCKKHKLLFFHIPKTAGTSIKTILINDLEGINFRTHVAARFVEMFVNNFRDYTIFAVVRNPYSRAVSWYNHLVREAEHGKNKELIIRPDSFEQFVKEQTTIYKNKHVLKNFGLWTTQKEFLTIDGELITNIILRYENLQKDFDLFCENNMGILYDLPHMKKWGVQSDYERFYTDELREIVYNRMKEDFESFGYGA